MSDDRNLVALCGKPLDVLANRRLDLGGVEFPPDEDKAVPDGLQKSPLHACNPGSDERKLHQSRPSEHDKRHHDRQSDCGRGHEPRCRDEQASPLEWTGPHANAHDVAECTHDTSSEMSYNRPGHYLQAPFEQLGISWASECLRPPRLREQPTALLKALLDVQQVNLECGL